MKSYEEMLEEAYSKLSEEGVSISKGRTLEIPLPKVSYQKNWTILVNAYEFAKAFNRDINLLARFLQVELNAPIKKEERYFIIQKRVSVETLRRKMERFAKEFVICPVCGKADTVIIKKDKIMELKCMACGAISPITYRLR